MAPKPKARVQRILSTQALIVRIATPPRIGFQLASQIIAGSSRTSAQVVMRAQVRPRRSQLDILPPVINVPPVTPLLALNQQYLIMVIQEQQAHALPVTMVHDHRLMANRAHRKRILKRLMIASFATIATRHG
jgi:hypothetical protein